MGSLDRPDVPHEPAEIASAPADQPKPAYGDNLANLSSEDVLSADQPVDALPRWKPGDPISVPPVHVRTDIGPGAAVSDYRDPTSHDPRQVESGQIVVIGKTGSPDNPKRYAEVQDGIRVVDLDTNESLPDEPAGEEFLDDIGPTDRSRGRDLLKGTVERFDDTAEAIQKAGDQLEMALKNPAPTGTGTRLPPGTTVFDAPPNAATTGSLAVGIVELTVLGVAAVRTGMRNYRAAIEKRSDDAGDG
jgi:hypothetical protein